MLITACSISLCLLGVFGLILDRVVDIGLSWAHRLKRWRNPSAPTRPRLQSSQPLRYLGSPASSSSPRARLSEFTF